jgi:hypothetical protein
MKGVNLRYTVSTFVNVTMYPTYNYNMLKENNKRKRGKNQAQESNGMAGITTYL